MRCHERRKATKQNARDGESKGKRRQKEKANAERQESTQQEASAESREALHERRRGKKEKAEETRGGQSDRTTRRQGDKGQEQEGKRQRKMAPLFRPSMLRSPPPTLSASSAPPGPLSVRRACMRRAPRVSRRAARQLRHRPTSRARNDNAREEIHIL